MEMWRAVPAPNLASPPFTHSPTIAPTPFLPYYLTIGGSYDFRSAVEEAAATVFAADLVLPLLLATVWSTLSVPWLPLRRPRLRCR